MKMQLDRFPVYAVVFPAIIAGTLLILFGGALLEGIIYPVFRKVAYMSVKETEPSFQFVEEEPGLELSDTEREELKEKVIDEYKNLYGQRYEKRLKEDIKAARDKLGDDGYERMWGDVLEDFEKK
jgi:hypothetical protein